MDPETRPSPFDGLDVPFLSRMETGSFCCYRLTHQKLNNLYLGENMAVQAGFMKPYDTYSSEQYQYPPFDIATLNCYDYERSKPQDLIEKLSERILMALEEAEIA